MKRILLLSAIIFSTLFFVSCNKDSNNASSDLTGDWKFISQEVAIKSTAQYRDPDFGTLVKSITTTNYTTVDNTGDVKIEPDKMTLSNMSYRIATSSFAEFYEDGELVDTLTAPFEYAVPEFTSMANYKLIGSDSIYFTSGSFSFIQSNTSTPSNPNGMKYSLQDDKLKLYTNYSESKTQVQQGVSINVLHEVILTVNCERK